MPTLLESVVDGMLTVAKTVLADATVVMREEQAARRNWRTDIETGALTPPYVTLRFSGARRVASDFPSAPAFRVTVSIFYFTERTQLSDQTQTLLDLMLSLYEALDNDDWQTFPAQFDPEQSAQIEVGVSSEALGPFVELNANLEGAQLTADVLVVTPGKAIP